MAELAKGLHVVEGIESENIVAIIEDSGSISLIDCGDPGSSKAIFRYLEEQGKNPHNIRNLILTHFDLDHTGAAKEIKQKTACQIMAHEFDAEVISGRRFTKDELKRRFPDYNSIEIDELHGKIGGQEIPAVAVDRTLRGGEQLDISGGARIVHVPGHTPGHIVVFLPTHSALIAGDTLSAPEGRVGPPAPQYTPVPRQAAQSLKKLSDLEFDILVSYHWPPITSGAGKAVKKYLDTL
jgi:glyoxylase-like metal-dependent hydrolase (beta-lactamase superfamily II)